MCSLRLGEEQAQLKFTLAAVRYLDTGDDLSSVNMKLFNEQMDSCIVFDNNSLLSFAPRPGPTHLGCLK